MTIIVSILNIYLCPTNVDKTKNNEFKKSLNTILMIREKRERKKEYNVPCS